MSQLVALSTSIGVLGAIWTYLALGLLGGVVVVWGGFIAWGCYFHTGGDTKALVKTICGNVYGIIIAWIALCLIFKTGIGGMGVVAIAIVVGVTVFLLVIVASIDKLSVVPANVYGYAATVAYSLTKTDATDSLTLVTFDNPPLLLAVSMILGAIFGHLSGKLAKALTKLGA